MEDEDFPVASQLGFSDEVKDAELASPPKRPKKRPRTAYLAQENEHSALPDPQDSPALSRVSFYTRGLENNHALPQPAFFPISSDSVDLLAKAVPTDGSRSLPRRSATHGQRKSPLPSHLSSLEPTSRDGTVSNPSQMQRMRALPESPVADTTWMMCAPFSSRKSAIRDADTKAIGTQEFPEIPSPPVFSSDEDGQIKEEEKFTTPSVNQPWKTETRHIYQTDSTIAKNRNRSHTSPANVGSKNQTQIIEDTGNPPGDSKNSSYFSFSRILVEQGSSSRGGRELKTENTPKNPTEPTEHSSEPRKRYYMRAFDYVVTEVLSRYSKVLSEHDIKTVNLIKQGITLDAQALFIRVYRRKQPRWYRASALKESYRTEFDVSAAIEELCKMNIVLSSKYIAEGSQIGAQVLARDLISTLGLDEIRQLCDSLVDGKKLKKLPKSKLLPKLKSILLGTYTKKTTKRKLRQTTLTGATPSQNLARAVLKTTGHSIRIPDHILTSLEKVHFLFFLEDGHDSPNVVLADTGKTKFPNYSCDFDAMIFPSRSAYEDYRTALSLEQELDHVLATKSYMEAADLGSIAELEVREFFESPIKSGDIIHDRKSSGRGSELKEQWASLVGINASTRSAIQKEEHKQQIAAQLDHPFFRRYTAQWVYVRACWHTVHALECLREYESAVGLLQLILSTSLVPKRRGKCLNRLTINIFKHLGRLQEALDIVRNALESKEFRLHLGDRQALARRGVAIHKRLTAQSQKALRAAKKLEDEEASAHSDRKEYELMPELPYAVTQVLNETEEEIVVRKIFGKSLNVQAREFQTKEAAMQRDQYIDVWGQQLREEIINSATSSIEPTFSVNGKAWFSSLVNEGAIVSVEEYCREWYVAKEEWVGMHDEGKSIRFLFCLLMWESALFASVPDVFQTPYQDRPLDLFTEAFYKSRTEAIENRLHELCSWLPSKVFSEVATQYATHMGTRAIGCDWNSYSASDLATIGAGLGGPVLSHCFRLLSLDYSYWGTGLPDLTLWKRDENSESLCYAKLVEVKSARDALSEVQRAWLLELKKAGAACEVCKVVEKVTSVNAQELEQAALDYESIEVLNTAVPTKNNGETRNA